MKLDDEFYQLDFSIQKSRRYHEKLALFYSRWRDRSRVVSVVVGSGAFLIVSAGEERFAVFASAIVALWAVLDLVIQPDKKSELHASLGRRFTGLAIEMASAKKIRAEYARLRAARLEIEQDEPSCKRLIDLEARNDEARARDHAPDDQVPLSRLQRRLGYYFDFGMPRLEKWKQERQRLARALEEVR